MISYKKYSISGSKFKRKLIPLFSGVSKHYDPKSTLKARSYTVYTQRLFQNAYARMNMAIFSFCAHAQILFFYQEQQTHNTFCSRKVHRLHKLLFIYSSSRSGWFKSHILALRIWGKLESGFSVRVAVEMRGCVDSDLCSFVTPNVLNTCKRIKEQWWFIYLNLRNNNGRERNN